MEERTKFSPRKPAYITETKLNRDDLKPGQKAALVIRLFYEEERKKAEKRKQATQFGSCMVSPDLGYPTTGKVAEELAKKAGIGRSSMEYLIAVFKKRHDLFERVFNGEISINKAYTQMKADDSCTCRNRGMTEKGALVSFNRAPTSLRHPQASVFR